MFFIFISGNHSTIYFVVLQQKRRLESLGRLLDKFRRYTRRSHNAHTHEGELPSLTGGAALEGELVSEVVGGLNYLVLLHLLHLLYR